MKPSELILSRISTDIIEKGFSIVDNILSEEQVKALLSRFIELKNESEFEKAGIGKVGTYQINSEVRGDFIRWIEETDLNAPTAPLYALINELIPLLNRTCYLGIRDFESHYAFYPKGKGYQTHRDRFKNNAHRLISFVFYLNENWTPSHGGELILYNEDLTEKACIHPIANRLAVFLSETLHEVKECHAERKSITGWLLDQPKGVTFIALNS